MAEIKQGDRIVWARSNDGAEQTGQVAAVRPNGVKLTNGEYVPFGQIVAPHLDVPAPEAEAGGKAGVGKCATEGCGKPLAHKQARYCPDCATARDRACKAAYAQRRAAAAKQGGWTRRRAPACPEFYAPLEEVLAAGTCASAVEVHAALAARMGPDAKVPDVSALRFHCRRRKIVLPRRSPEEHARRMMAFRQQMAPDKSGPASAKGRKATPKVASATRHVAPAATAQAPDVVGDHVALQDRPLCSYSSLELEAEMVRRAIAQTEAAIQTALRQIAAMTAKNVSRQAELERTMRIILAGQQQRRDISA